jgi:hypothetical protein
MTNTTNSTSAPTTTHTTNTPTITPGTSTPAPKEWTGSAVARVLGGVGAAAAALGLCIVACYHSYKQRIRDRRRNEREDARELARAEREKARDQREKARAEREKARDERKQVIEAQRESLYEQQSFVGVTAVSEEVIKLGTSSASLKATVEMLNFLKDDISLYKIEILTATDLLLYINPSKYYLLIDSEREYYNPSIGQLIAMHNVKLAFTQSQYHNDRNTGSCVDNTLLCIESFREFKGYVLQTTNNGVSHSLAAVEYEFNQAEEIMHRLERIKQGLYDITAQSIENLNYYKVGFVTDNEAHQSNQPQISTVDNSFPSIEVQNQQMPLSVMRSKIDTNNQFSNYLHYAFFNWIHRNNINKLTELLKKHGLDLAWQDALKGNGFKKVALKLHPDKSTGSKEEFQNFIHIKDQLERGPSITLDEVLREVQLVTNKAFLSLRMLDTSIAVVKLYHEPTKHNLREAGLSALHTFCSFEGLSKASIVLSTVSAFNAYQNEGGVGALGNLLTSAAFIVAPYAITYAGIPYVGPAYTLGITFYTGYNLISNSYALYKDLSAGDNTLKSLAAYRDLYLTLSQAIEIEWFTEKAQEYIIQINRFNAKIEKESTLVQLENKYGEALGDKLFKYIYEPFITEKHKLAAEVELSNLSEQEANSILASKLTSIPGANYSIFRLDESFYKELHYDSCRGESAVVILVDDTVALICEEPTIDM